MRQLKREIEENFNSFSKQWKSSLETTINSLEKENLKFLESYIRLVSLQAWRQFLKSFISEDSLDFFLEAQNDALTSHVFSRVGSWRSSLKSLRSAIENVLFCLYYMDHPVELALWHMSKHKLGFSEMNNYFAGHPSVFNYGKELSGLVILEKEYATLSKAVHASAKGFRMTLDTKSTLLWNDSKNSLGSWATREKAVMLGLNLLLLVLFSEHLQGTSHQYLRDVAGLAIPTSMHRQVKDKLGISLTSW